MLATLMGYMNNKIKKLDESTPWAKASLAKLRRGVGKDPREDPEVWEIILGGLDADLAAKYDEPSYAENAIYAALTLYALHKQGNDISLHIAGDKDNPGPGFGDAIAKLKKPDDNDNVAIIRRFNMLVTANDLTELAFHARGLIQLLRGCNQPVKFNYAGFAKDLYRFQFEEMRRNVVFKWGEAFYKNRQAKDDNHE